MKQAQHHDLYTPEGENMHSTPWNAYPRPTLQRDSFLNLNGEWEFAVLADASSADDVLPGYPDKICVPFPPESLLSGVHMRIPQKYIRRYRRNFSLPDGFLKEKLILHFGAVDQIADVYLNGKHIGSHRGGYEAFSFDVTAAMQPENELTVLVRDELDRHILPYGKQRENRGGMWYTPVSGIWQTVWMESVPQNHIEGLDIQTDTRGAVISTGNSCHNGKVYIQTPEGEVVLPLEKGRAEYCTENPRMWSPEDPWLYHFTIETQEDRVQSYFALRTLESKNIDGIPRLCLNGKPYFFHALLDQGYWSDGIFTPANPDCFVRDLEDARKLGFNTLRKHIKIEPEIFYYECDRRGMIVFQDMVNNGSYSFFRDTALPTVGIKRLPAFLLQRSRAVKEAFYSSMETTVRQLKKHPCICLWTIFNEGWGQFDASGAYRRLKQMDPTRWIDSASGWFTGGESDVESHHVYFKPYKFRSGRKPVILSEFGGYSFKPEGHVFNPGKTYGYRFFKDRKAYQDALEKLYLDEIVPAVKRGLCSAVYTQLADVEDETNGLVSYDRKYIKPDADVMQKIAKKLKL